jgi:hypothetical protein
MTPMRVIKLMDFLAVPAAAQCLNLPRPGIPRTADHQLNLSPAAPRTAAGKPDFSGMWVPRDVLTCDTKERGVQCTKLPLRPQLLNFAVGLKNGLPYQPWAADLVKSRAKDVAYLDPHVYCMLPQFPASVGLPWNRKKFQTTGQVVILHEFNASYRQIFFGGRKLPDDMLPTWNGYSVGHWESDTLVVESAGYCDDSWLDTAGNFFSSQARVTERIRRPDFGSLDVDVTVNDAKVFTQPRTVVLHMRSLVDTPNRAACLGNNETRSRWEYSAVGSGLPALPAASARREAIREASKHRPSYVGRW